MGGGDVLVQQAQGRGARCTGEVELGEFAFGEGGRSHRVMGYGVMGLLVVSSERWDLALNLSPFTCSYAAFTP